MFIISINFHNRSTSEYKCLYFTNKDTRDQNFSNLSNVIELTTKLKFDDNPVGSNDWLPPLCCVAFNFVTISQHQRGQGSKSNTSSFYMMRKISSGGVNRVAKGPQLASKILK